MSDECEVRKGERKTRTGISQLLWKSTKAAAKLNSPIPKQTTYVFILCALRECLVFNPGTLGTETRD